MRLIGHLDNDRDATALGDYLHVKGIETEFERDGEQWAIWVLSDDHLAEAGRCLTEFRQNPADPKFQAAAPAARLRAQTAAENEAHAKRVVPARRLFPRFSAYGLGLITLSLMVFSIGIFLVSSMGDNLGRIAALFITHVEVDGERVKGAAGWGALQKLELWRLFTPIFIHFGIGHILFNMFWLKDLGGLFEARLGSRYFLAFVLVVAGLSNAAQYFVTGQPVFGGMSGVNYALIGYCWVRGRLDPFAGVGLDQQSLILALIWFALCFTGWVGPIANTVHTVGLLVGAGWAFVDSKRR